MNTNEMAPRDAVNDAVTLTWREELARARERGTMPRETLARMGSMEKCFAAEVAVKVWGLNFGDIRSRDPRSVLWKMGYDALGPLYDGDWDKAEAVLDAIEDRALQLKREAEVRA